MLAAISLPANNPQRDTLIEEVMGTPDIDAETFLGGLVSLSSPKFDRDAYLASVSNSENFPPYIRVIAAEHISDPSLREETLKNLKE